MRTLRATGALAYSSRLRTRARVAVLNRMNYAERRQLKEKYFRTAIHSVTSTRLLHKHGDDGSQVAAQMTSLITHGFKSVECCSGRAHVPGFLQMAFSVNLLPSISRRVLETSRFVVQSSMC